MEWQICCWRKTLFVKDWKFISDLIQKLYQQKKTNSWLELSIETLAKSHI